MQPDLFQTTEQQRREREREAKFLKRFGINSVEHRNYMGLEYLRTFARSHSDKHGSVTIEDVRDYAQQVGVELSHPNAWGALFKGKGWKPCGEHRNTIPSTHHRRVLMWRYDIR